MATAPSWDFDRDTEIESVGPGRWSTEISSDWNIGDNPNGGYAQASTVRAMRAALADAGTHTATDPAPVSVTTHFLRPTSAGERAEVGVEVIRAGRRTATMRAELVQGDSRRLLTTATFSPLPVPDGSSGGPGVEGVGPPRLAPRAPMIPEPRACLHRSALAQGVELPLMSRVEVRIVPEYAEPGTADHAATAGWIRFADGRPADAWSLPLFADCFPPTLFSLLGRVGWVPTVELTVHVRARPVEGWIQAEFSTTDLADGFLVEDGRLWDESGRLVARSRQLALLLPY